MLLSSVYLIPVMLFSTVAHTESSPWWDSRWRMRTTVTKPSPYQDGQPRVAEVVLDFPYLLKQAGVDGEFDPSSIRIIEGNREVPFAYRKEFDARKQKEQYYLAWYAQPEAGQIGAVDIYFDTRDQGIEAPDYDAESLPPENLISNPNFEDKADGWSA